VFTHAIAGAAIALAAAPAGRVRTTAALAAAAAVLPDIDALGVQFGFGHGHGLLGHRGLTHSLLFAALAASAVALVFRRRPERGRVGLCVFAAAVSHGMLDALTNGGGGVAFLAPFDSSRYFFPVTPIRVSPLRAKALFSERGAAVLGSEMRWVWLPAGLVALASAALRSRLKASANRD
jgi:inner membrane protein